jgi:integrase
MARFHQYDSNSFILPKEVRRIILAVPEVSKHPERDQILTSIGWETGGRVSEVLGLVPEHVLEESIVLTNLKQHHKGKKPPTKIVVVSKELCDWIKRYCEKENIGRGELIFHAVRDKTKPLGRGQVQDMITAASEAAHVFRLGKANPRTGGRYKGISFHTLRHSYATQLLKTTKMEIVAAQLGHSDIRSTQAYASAAYDDVKGKVKAANVHLYHP